MTDAPETDARFLAPVSGACVMGIRLHVSRRGGQGISVSAPNVWNDLSFNCRAATCVNE